MSKRCERFLSTNHELPSGIIHGDLFHDNALFIPSGSNDRLSGLIDFYHSGPGFLIYDLAVAINDWCINADRTLDEKRMNAMVTAYQAIRPFNENEQAAWPNMLVFAAYRFWISRLLSKVNRKDKTKNSDSNEDNGLILTEKDPEEFKWLMLNNQQLTFTPR